MRRTVTRLRLASSSSIRWASSASSPAIVRIDAGTFYRRQPQPASDPVSESTRHDDARDKQSAPDASNPPMFPDLTFSIPSGNTTDAHWAIIGPSNAGKTTLLEVLRGRHLCFPPRARSFPYLSSQDISRKDPKLRYPENALEYVGFDTKEKGLSGMGTYMSARYESRREVSDFALRDFLQGRTQLNAAKELEEQVDPSALARVCEDLRLGDLLDMPVSNLSNGQTRRARIARALLGRPEVLLLDEPFMGLDPPTTLQLSALLQRMANTADPRVLLALRPQDWIPEWITHLMFLGPDLHVAYKGRKEDFDQVAVEEAVRLVQLEQQPAAPASETTDVGAPVQSVDDEYKVHDFFEISTGTQIVVEKMIRRRPKIGEAVVEMDGVQVKYGDKVVLGRGHTAREDRTRSGLVWKVLRGQRWGVFGPNGSGKTTLLSLISSDHPQAYSQPIKLFGRHRLPSPGEPGISIFELQRRIGHSSPEVHAFFPRGLSVRSTLESAFADTPLSRPALNIAADERISLFLRWFQGELNPAKGPNRALEFTLLSGVEARPDNTEWPTNTEIYRERNNEWWYNFHLEQSAAVEWADSTKFGELSFTAQRLVLFLRAIVASPDIVVLDEAFSGFDATLRDKCLLFLEAGEKVHLRAKGVPYSPWYRDLLWDGKPVVGRSRPQLKTITFGGLTDDQALICVSHVQQEAPRVVRHWLYLPDASIEPPEKMRWSYLNASCLTTNEAKWRQVWGLR